MKLAVLLPALAALGLSGCVSYGYSDDGYYYGRPSASVGGYYGGIGYGSGGWRYGYGMSYGYPGYYGYYDPYSGYYYDPYYGYYFRRPPIVIIQRPPGDHHDGHDHGDHDGHDHGDHDGRRPPWRDLDNLSDRRPIPARAPDANDGGARPRLLHAPPDDRGALPRVRAPDRAVNPPMRLRTPDPIPTQGSDDFPRRNGDRRR